ncbi:MAG: RHS repeat-associated core domain-containing protein [Akkermansia sp.]|nr:RHS repeat-associated core domain-containing protein [Akkermansia sp.]
MTLTLSYEEKRDLLTGMVYKRSNTQVASRSYTYDTLGRLTSRGTTRDGQSVSDSFAYNNRSELTTATVSGESYAYDYDNIGNRAAAVEDCSGVASRTEYETNQLNQYTAIGDFVPTFDDAGNQTLVKTSTGIWAVTYDAENRPTLFSNAESSTTVECTYDYMGRRATKKVTVNGSVTLHQRYIYRGYLQIACCDLTRTAQTALWLLTWDPTQTTATRPLAIQINGTWFTYGWDLTKNICEVYGQHGYIRTAYTYTPYGSVTMSGDLIQPIQWSSEYHDTELALVYYNYRHYNPMDGRWLGRDSIEERGDYNLYCFVDNSATCFTDIRGNEFCCDKCSRIGVLKADVLITITSDFGSPEVADGFNKFSTGFNYALNSSEKVFPPIKIVSNIYTSTVESASKFLNNRYQISRDKRWVVHGKIKYTVCEIKKCWLFWERKDVTDKETKWVHSGYILPDKYGDAEWEVKRKLQKALKTIEGV